MKNNRMAPLNIQEITKKITADEFVKYLNEFGPNTKCSFCGNGDYGVGQNPTDSATSMVATPVPDHNGVGLWFFPATCLDCGHTIFFSATKVAKKIKGID